MFYTPLLDIILSFSPALPWTTQLFPSLFFPIFFYYLSIIIFISNPRRYDAIHKSNWNVDWKKRKKESERSGSGWLSSASINNRGEWNYKGELEELVQG
jgi:hypothetical protein